MTLQTLKQVLAPEIGGESVIGPVSSTNLDLLLQMLAGPVRLPHRFITRGPSRPASRGCCCRTRNFRAPPSFASSA